MSGNIFEINSQAKKRYVEDARLLIKKLADNEIQLKNGELNHIGVHILIKTACSILNSQSVEDAIKGI